MQAAGRCGACDAPTSKQCTGCRQAFFCSPACLAAAWKAHKRACRAAAAAAERVASITLPLPPPAELHPLKAKLLALAGCPPAGAPFALTPDAPLPRSCLLAARIGALTRDEMAAMKLEALQAGELVSAANERAALDALLAAIRGGVAAAGGNAAVVATLEAAEAAVFALHEPSDAAGQPGNDAAELAAALRAAEPELLAAEAAAAEALGPRLKALGLRPAEVESQLAEVRTRIRLSKLQEAASGIGSREPGEPPGAHACAAAAAAVSASVAASLFATGFAVVDGALSAADAAALCAELEAAQRSGELRPVAVQAAVGTRQDCVRYASPDDARVGPATAAAMRLLRGVAAALETHDVAPDKALPPLAVPRHCMLACYPGSGAAYAPHRDNSPDLTSPSRNRRAVTALLYANASDWVASRDGGCLRCHVGAAVEDEDGCARDCARGCAWPPDAAGGGGATSACHVDVAPLAGRLVLFRSDGLLHEVLPAHRRRFALSCWILDARLPVKCEGMDSLD